MHWRTGHSAGYNHEFRCGNNGAQTEVVSANSTLSGLSCSMAFRQTLTLRNCIDGCSFDSDPILLMGGGKAHWQLSLPQG